MVTKVTTIKKLKEAFATRIRNTYGLKPEAIQREIATIKIAHNEVLMKDLEKLITDVHPSLKKTVKCDFRHSESSTDTITLVFKVDLDLKEVKDLKKKYDAAMAEWSKKKDELEDWETRALMANLKAEGIPEFKL
jgi:predicted transcriptional regulator